MTEQPKRGAQIHMTYHGAPVVLTVTDKPLGDIEQLIDGLLARDGWAASAAAVAVSNGHAPQGDAPVCPYHGPMKESTIKGKQGTYYCSKKMADGSYCQERYPK